MIENINEEGKTFPPLVSRIFREFVDKNYTVAINELTEKCSGIAPVKILNLLREPFYWKVYTAGKENNKPLLWQVFNQYNSFFQGQIIGSEYHSKVLNSAMFSMTEAEEWRFLAFFENWNPETFIEPDWKEVVKGDQTYKPLAIKALKKAFENIKSGGKPEKLTTIISAYDTAVSKFPKDNWLLRERALLQFKNVQHDEAIRAYRNLVLELGDKSYLWHEFSQFVMPADVKSGTGMLCKSVLLEKDESFLGEIRLELADALIKQGLLNEAAIELSIYKMHREFKGWRFSEKYHQLLELLPSPTDAKDNNTVLYQQYAHEAEEFAYHEIECDTLVLTEKWKNDKGKEKLNFTDGKEIEIAISAKRFPAFKNAEAGDVFQFKVYRKLLENTSRFSSLKYDYIPLLATKATSERWGNLDSVVAVVDYINAGKKIIHAITTDSKEVFFPQGKLLLQIGDFVSARLFIKTFREEKRTELRNIQKVEKQDAITSFPKLLTVVDGVNNEKQLFHYVASSKIHGVIRFSETALRPEKVHFWNCGSWLKWTKSTIRLFIKLWMCLKPTVAVQRCEKTLQGFKN